jgi:penicillin-binding protein 1A
MARRIGIANRRRGGIVGHAVRFLLAVAVVGSAAAGGAALYAYVRLADGLPPIPPFDAIRFGGVNTVRAAGGQVLAESFEQRRYLVARDRIPDVLVKAFLASEDARFFEHEGLDLRGIARALWSNLRAGEVREGASTITQQLARSLLLSNQKSVTRKVREAILARRIEDIYSKDQILTLYLNLIFLGEGSYGVQAASRVYFGKDVADLTPAEAATIAALPQSPGKVNPVRNAAETRVRRDRVLRRMRETGALSAAQEEEARQAPVATVPGRDDLGDKAPYAAVAALEAMRPLAAGDGGVDLLAGRDGLTAVTAIDLGTQLAAQDAAWDAARAIDRRQGFRGPVARLPEASWPDFERRNRAWLDRRGWTGDLPLGRMVLAVVTAVEPAAASVTVAADVEGTLPLANLSWAAPYSEFPRKEGDDGPREEIPRVSLDGRVDDASRVLRPGDVVLVQRVIPVAPKPPAAPKRKKGKKAPEPPPPPPREEAPKGPVFSLAQVPRPQAALVAADPRQGYVVALAGGSDFDLSQFDRTRSRRQTGSVIKPVYYSKAYDVGIPPSTVVSGAPFRDGGWAPEGEKAADDMTLYQALTQSENNCSLRVFRMVLERVGLDSLNEWAGRLGLARPFAGYPAEGLGIDASPLEVLRAYGTLATGGIRSDPALVKWVSDGRGRPLLDRRSPRDPSVSILDAVAREVASPGSASSRAITTEAAWIVAHNLRQVAEEGTARATRRLGRPVCGKTGTLPYDVWFAGWTHELAAVAWVGEDQRERYLGRTRASGGVFGADTALPAWVSFSRQALAGRPPRDDLVDVPEGVAIVRVDPATGLLATDGGLLVPHLKGTEPRDEASGDAAMEEELAEF